MDNNLDSQHNIISPRDFLSLEKQNPREAETYWHNLSFSERLNVVLNAQGVERERLIVLARDSQELTQALAPDEFSRTVLEVGAEDAGMLISLSSDEQLTYFFDLIGWIKGKLAPARYNVWLPILLEAGSKRIERWLVNVDLEVLTLLFAYWIKVVKYLPSQDMQEPPDKLPEFTLDGIYFIEFCDQFLSEFVLQILVLLKNNLPDRYQEVLEAIFWEPTTNMIEDAARWRQGRMMDYGFPNRLEALELWANPLPGEAIWATLPCKTEIGFFTDRVLHSDNLSFRLLPIDCTLPALIRKLDGPIIDILRAELAYIANCGVVALDIDCIDLKAVAQAGCEGLGLVNIGLEFLIQDSSSDDAVAILERLPLTALARQGASIIRRLKRRAWSIMNKGWLAGLPTGLHLLDSPLDHWLAGLLFKYPRCYDSNLEQSQEYRAFLNLVDLARAEDYINQIEFCGYLLLDLIKISRQELFELFNVSVWPEDKFGIKITTIVGTWLARRAIGLSGLAPIPIKSLQEAIAALKTELNKDFLSWELTNSHRLLSKITNISLANKVLHKIFADLKEEVNLLFSRIDDIDLRFISSLVIEQ